MRKPSFPLSAPARMTLAVIAAVFASLTTTLVAVSTEATAAVAAPQPTANLNNGSLVFGVVSHSRAELERHQQAMGRRIPLTRVYRLWGQPLFTADDTWARDQGTQLYLSIKSFRADGSPISYRDVANAVPGSPVYGQLVSVANQIHTFRAPILIAYNHEPEARRAWTLGSGADYAAAWRNVVAILRAHGASNARFAWTMTDWSFERTDEHRASAYWPGAAYVDYIGVDAYNFSDCRGFGTWLPFAQAMRGVLAWQLAHAATTPIVVAEWSSTEWVGAAARKPAWIDEVTRLAKTPAFRSVVAMIQWGNPQVLPNCTFQYWSSPFSQAALSRMAHNATFTSRRVL